MDDNTRQPQPTGSQGEQQQHPERESMMPMTRTTTTTTTRLERLLAMEDALHGIEGNIFSNNNNNNISQIGSLRNSNNSSCMMIQMMMMRPPHSVWREKVTQWCYNVVDHLDECRSVVYVAMNILDRFTAIVNNNNGSNSSSMTMMNGMMNERCFELASMSALFLAIRIAGNNDSAGNNLQLSQLVSMTSSTSGIQSKHIVAMGTRIIQRLGNDYWRIRCVTPLDFLQTFFVTLSSTRATTEMFSAADQQEVLNAASFLCEIAVCDSVVAITERPSHIALAALLNALQAHFHQEEDDNDENSNMSTGCMVKMAMMERCTNAIPHDAQSLMRLRLRLQAVYGQTLDSSSSQPRSGAAGAAATSLPHVVPQDVASPTAYEPNKFKHCVSNDTLCNNNKRPLDKDHVVLVMAAAATSPSRKKKRAMQAHGNLPSLIHPDE